MCIRDSLDDDGDILYYGNEYMDYTELIAQRAAISLWTQLRGDNEAYVLLERKFNDNLKTFARANPRRRIQGTFNTYLKR